MPIFGETMKRIFGATPSPVPEAREMVLIKLMSEDYANECKLRSEYDTCPTCLPFKPALPRCSSRAVGFASVVEQQLGGQFPGVENRALQSEGRPRQDESRPESHDNTLENRFMGQEATARSQI
ncbi:unnamed protein product, partial [Mesorhabditis belari]|uniref:Uncharacterized protein n=1 Tax=Mesorhabditis belari TaxID=2138241 RepID=A0AAF3FPC7_9BILA